MKFKTMYNDVLHVDEKWFYLMRDDGQYYLAADKDPQRAPGGKIEPCHTRSDTLPK
jgi:hypothetical protein